MKISACVKKVRALSACTARHSGGGFVAATASAASGLSGQSANPEPAGKPKSAVTHGHAFYGHRTERNLAWVHRTDSLLCLILMIDFLFFLLLSFSLHSLYFRLHTMLSQTIRVCARN